MCELVMNGDLVKQSDLLMLQRDFSDIGSQTDWKLQSFHEISSRLSDSKFPCLFGRHAWKHNSLLFTFISETDRTNNMLNSLIQFINRTQTLPIEQRLYSPLLMVFEQEGFVDLKEAQEFSWKCLQEIHDGDHENWPDSIPISPEDRSWSFCFGGVELFINISCPGHQKIRSRNLGSRVVFVINPRQHFDVLASSKDIKGIKVREKIRDRVSNYNQGHVSKELGFYGDDNKLEWKQYQLNEEGSLNLHKCPLKISKER